MDNEFIKQINDIYLHVIYKIYQLLEQSLNHISKYHQFRIIYFKFFDTFDFLAFIGNFLFYCIL